MNYARAMAKMELGARVKRSLWDSWLVKGNPVPQFILPARLALELGTDYLPTAVERAACDWIVSP